MATADVILKEGQEVDYPVFTAVFKGQNFGSVFTKKVILPMIGKQLAELS
jgi:hypothetical protein